MKTSILILAALFTMITNISAQTNNNADKILGQYWSPKKDGKIEIYKYGDKYFGKFVWGVSPRKDTKNPDEKLRSREIVGMTFLSNFSHVGNNYVDGKIYDPESGKTYKCKIWLDNGNLKVRGYVGFSLLGRTETFEKIQ
jgi:uncharacterized protein (DUF2147 family)